MPDFVELTAEETRGYKLFQRFNRRVATLNLRRLGAQAEVTLADAVTAGVERKRPQPYTLLARVAQRRAGAYEILVRHGPATRWARYKRYKAFRALGLST